MLSSRISKLFRLLQCTNTDIARFAGCSPSNISRLKSGMRDVGPDSRSVRRLVEGVYRYADYENMMTVLCELCGTEDRRADTLIPALLDWLYAESDFSPTRTVIPRSKKTQEIRLRSFGDRLDQTMILVELSNSLLASALNVDDSLVSRYRSGIYHPNRNERIKERLSEILLLQAKKKNRDSELADLCGINVKDLNTEALTEWLFGVEENSASAIAETLFRSIDMFAPGETLPVPGDATWANEPGVHTAAPSHPGDVTWANEPGVRTAAPSHPGDVTLPNEPGIHTAASSLPNDVAWANEPDEEISSNPPEIRYWGDEGLRRAVVRFLTNAAREGGELLLYSDEPMDWLASDPAYFARWAAMMTECIQSGVSIKIIHNIDRTDMISAIRGWFPLYISGMIVPYIFRKVRNPRFNHTVFLRPNREAILGFFPAEHREPRWYDYISDERQLETIAASYQTMLSGASPFLKIYPVSRSNIFRRFFMNIQIDKCLSILSGLSIGTMPTELLEQMLTRAHIAGPSREEILAVHQMRRRKLHEILSFDSVDEVLCLPSREAVLQGKVRVNLSAELLDIPLFYTPEEYAAHASAVLSLVDREKNYHLTLLPQNPFRDLQVCIMHDTAAVMRCGEPLAAFVLTNRLLVDSVREYASTLIRQYGTDRGQVMAALKETCGEL